MMVLGRYSLVHASVTLSDTGTRSEMAERRFDLGNDSFATPPPSTSERLSFTRCSGAGKGGFILQTRFNNQGVLEPILSEEQLAHCEAALKLLLEKTQEPAGRKRLYAEFQALQVPFFVGLIRCSQS